MNNLLGRNLLVVDLETSGVNPFVHEVLAVGLVPVDDKRRPTVIYVRPAHIEWTEFARRNFEKFRAEWDASALAPVEACKAIDDYVRTVFGGQEATLIGHNIGFDTAFLRKLAYEGGRDEFSSLSHRVIDTHTLLYTLTLLGRLPGAAVTSSEAFDHFDISVPEEKRHTALGDAIATRRLFLQLVKEFSSMASHR